MCWIKIKEKIKSFNFFKEEKRWQKTVIIILVCVLAVAVLSIGSAFAYQQYYKDKVYPGVSIGSYQIGGMQEEEVTDFVENFNNRIAKEGVDFYFINISSTEKFKINAVPADDSSVEWVRIESEGLALSAMSIGRTGKFWQDLWLPIYLRLRAQSINIPIVIEDRFVESAKNYLLNFGNPPHNAGVKISSINPLKYEVVPEQSGLLFDFDALKTDLQTNLASLSLEPVEVKEKAFSPDVVAGDLNAVLPKLADIFSYGNLSLNYIDPLTKIRRDWNITPDTFADWIEVVKIPEDGVVFALNKEKVQAYLETLRPLIDTQAQDAKFSIENDKVQEFQASQTGIGINAEKTYQDLDAVFRDRNFRPAEPAKTVSISVDVVKPNIEVADVNGLGISDIIGAGFSTFHDSHTNRIKNIANAVKRLNGVLIKPGEEFSTIKYAGPFTAENGFLPEAVIKGKEIKNEIGGGMCQIGTTMFRMAMNSGMPITERRNHSLVVSYYADPVNGNPGTDATVYEPIVDFRFLNDTGNYLLLQTNIDYKKQQLTFTLWGKSDGRKGWYTHPVVSRWIPAGEPEEIVSPTMKPGEKKCQAAFRGAVASFTYTRITSSSEKIDRVFESYYRPLPKICMVGASSTPAGGGGEAVGISSTIPVETP